MKTAANFPRRRSTVAKRRNYPGSIEKRGDSYRVRLCVAGQRYRKTLHSVSRAEAEQFARERYQVLRGRALREKRGLPGTVRVSGLLDRYEQEKLPQLRAASRVSYANSLRPIRMFFVEVLGDPSIDKIIADDIQRYIGWRRTRDPHGENRERPLSARSLEKEWSILHLVFERARRGGLIGTNPVLPEDKPEPIRREPVLPSSDEYEALLAACGERSNRLYLYTLVLGETGARCESEALWLRWEDVDLEKGFVRVRSGYRHHTKSGKSRYVPMTRRLREAMREHFARYRLITHDGERSPWIFHHVRRNRGARAGDRVECFRRPFMKAAKDAGLPEGFRTHDLRHLRVTSWMRKHSPALIQQAVGHADIKTTLDYYSHIEPEDLKVLVMEDEGGADYRRAADA
jgi:integrase